MTLDPVHFEGIARLARRISHDVDEADHRALAETVWEEFLDPLYAADGDHAVLEPIGDLRRRSADVQDVALRGDEYPTSHGLDSGTINPTTFKNGLVLDVAQAAMSACPSDLDLHRGRTIVMTAHTNDTTREFGGDDWLMDDAGYCRQRIIHAPRVSRYAEGVVHSLALYLAESEHALANAEVVADLLYLDGPIYPKGILTWLDRDPELAQLLDEADVVRTVLENYVRLVERFVAREVPVCGFVKNPGSKAVTRALRGRTEAPWTDDAALFRQLLERREGSGEDRNRHEGCGADRERRTDQLTFTNWFVSRGGADAVMSTAGDGLDVDLELSPEAYEVTFCAIYDPRDDVLYGLEAPYAVTRDADAREALVRQVLTEVAAARGPPEAVGKADALARISREEKESLRTQLEGELQSERERTYDDVRWPLEEL